MATVNKVLRNLTFDDGGRHVVSFDYDDQTFFLTGVHILNTTTSIPLPVQATVLKNGRTYSHTEPPGGPGAVEFFQSVPTGAANRLELFINPDNGRLDGVDWNIG